MRSDATQSNTGQCLCGFVTLDISNAGSSVGACHCKMCRRWGGGPFLEIGGGVDVQIKGREFVSVYSSSEWAERGFCSNCGSHLYYRVVATGEYTIPAGILDDVSHLKLDHQVYIDEKPSHYEFANVTLNFSTAEMIAKYGGVIPD